MNPAPETPVVADDPENLPPPGTFAAPGTRLVPPLQPAAPPAPSAGRRLWQKIATRQFLFWSIMIHLLFGVVATVFIVQTIAAKRKLTFTSAPPSPNKSTRATEHRVQMAQRQKTMSAPAQAKRVTTTAVNARVALPQMPAMPALASVVTPARMGGMGGAGFGQMSAGAPGGGGPGGGGPQLFGFRKATGGGSFVGTFFDFKQNRGGQLTHMAAFDRPNDPNAEREANAQTVKEVGMLAAGGLNEGGLAGFYRGPDPIYATQIYIPEMMADEGPKAFNLADKVRPRRWVVIYRASVTAPETGHYRFLGRTDDFLIVRFNHRIVLDGSITPPTNHKPAKTYRSEGLRSSLPESYVGDTFDATAGEKYDLEVLIGELPGGEFLSYLQIEKDGVEYAKDANNCPILPLFKLAPSEMASRGNCMPILAKDTTWSVWRAEKPGGNGLSSFSSN